MEPLMPIPESPGTAPAGPNAFSALGTDAFVRIIFTELSRQDPLAPNDTGTLLEQIATLREMQSSMDLSSRLTALVAWQELASAAGLIGRRVSGLNALAQRVEGVVRSVTRTPEGVVLTLTDGHHLRIRDLDEILEVGS